MTETDGIIEDIEISPQYDTYNTWNSMISDFGNESRLDKLKGKEILFDTSNEMWYIWNQNEGKWEKDQTGKIKEMTKSILRGIKSESKQYAERATETKDTGKKQQYGDMATALMTWANKCQNPTKIDACLKLAQSSHAILPDEFNKNSYLFNFTNGTFDLENMKIREHDKNDKISLSCGWKYDPNADCPEFKKFLNRLFKNHPQKDDLIRFVQMTLGYCLSGNTDRRIIILIIGRGSNGKSVLMATIARTFGDYSAVLNGESLTTISRGKVREDLAQLGGKRFVSVSESPKGATIDEDIVKHITGGAAEPLKIRSLYKNSFDFYPQCKIFWSFNHLPRVVDMTPSIWNRIRVVPFNEEISKSEEMDMSEIIKLHDKERSGILNWLIQGYQDLVATKNFNWCEAVNTRTDEYKEDEDTLGLFFDEVIESNEGAKVKASDLYDCYLGWAYEHGYTRPWNPTTFGNEISSRIGRHNKKRGGKGGNVFYHTIKIKDGVTYSNPRKVSSGVKTIDEN